MIGMREEEEEEEEGGGGGRGGGGGGGGGGVGGESYLGEDDTSGESSAAITNLGSKPSEIAATSNAAPCCEPRAAHTLRIVRSFKTLLMCVRRWCV